MKKYRIAIILRRKRTHFIYQLQKLFQEYMEFTTYSFEQGISPYINCDLALVPTQEVAEDVRPYLLPRVPIIVVRRTISSDAWEKVQQIPQYTKVLVVNTYWQMAIQTINMLYTVGLRHIKLIPFDNNSKEDFSDIDYAITANESAYIPKHISHVIEIGTRPVDISSLFDILTTLNLITPDTMKILREHEHDALPLNPGFVEMFNQFHQKHVNIASTLDLLDDAALIYDQYYRIHIYNRQLAAFFPPSQYQLTNQALAKLFPEKLIPRLINQTNIHNLFTHIHGQAVLISKSSLIENGVFLGGLILLRKTENLQTTDKEAIHLHHVNTAKYHFEDIQGYSHSLERTLRLAKRAAASDSDVLIQGESGTGKELFVQSIHNASVRAKAPFIAFNCAALTGSLMESELFGYEEGAFTGANRKGKQGLFEIANHGTIFLDEISEIPIDIQAKLLRVLQEREFIRVGGTHPVPIDVRIIAATNQDLYTLVKQKKFRLDLFFRLNVFNLKIPPLRERQADIPELVSYFLHEHHINTDFPQSTMQIFQRYQWPGNIRELKNCIEYMYNIGEGFEPENLPDYITQNLTPITNTSSITQNTDTSAKTNTNELDSIILQILYQTAQQHKHIGRKRLSELLATKDIFLGEQSVRHHLEQLAEKNLVQLSRGRNGTSITPHGIHYLKTQK